MVHKYDFDEAFLTAQNNDGKTDVTITTHRFEVSNRGQHGRERVDALFEFVHAMSCEGVLWQCA